MNSRRSGMLILSVVISVVDERDFVIRPYPAVSSETFKPETHYSVFAGDRIIAMCTFESSAIAVRDDAIRCARIAEHKSTSTLGTTPTQIILPDPLRKKWTIKNTSATPIFIGGVKD